MNAVTSPLWTAGNSHRRRESGAPDRARARRAVLRLALAGVRHRAAGSLAVFAAVVLGGALLVAAGGLAESALRLEATPQRLSGTPVVVGGSTGFRLPDEESEAVPYTERARVPAAVSARIAQVPGVRQAVPDVSFSAVLVQDGRPLSGGGVLSGHAWTSAALTPYTLIGGVEPSGRGQVVLDEASARRAGARPGDRVEIAVNGERLEFRVSGVARPAARVTAPALFFSAPDVTRFDRHPGAYDLVGVQPIPGVDADGLAQRIGHALGAGLTVVTGDDRGGAEFAGVAAGRLPLLLLAGVFGAMVLIVMALVVSATISLTIRQRRRELALLRATGATPRQVHRMVVAETMTVAALATAVGAALGGVAGRLIFSAGTGWGVLPAALVFRQGMVPYAGGVLLSLLVAYVSAHLAARPAARIRPIQALAEAALPPVRVNRIRRLLALVSAVATVALASTTMFMDPETAGATGGPAVLTGAVAVALVAPELLARLVTALGPWIGRIWGPVGDLAVLNVRARAVVLAAVLTPVTLATAVAMGNVYAQTTRGQAAVSGYAGQFRPDVVITSATGGIPDDLLAALGRTPGVGSVSAMVTSRGWIEKPYDGKGSDPMRLVGVTAQDHDGPLATGVTAGSLRGLDGDTVAVPRDEAGDLGITVGDRIGLRLGDGATVEAKVVALLDSSSAFPALVLPTGLLAPHTTSGLPTRALVRARPGQDVTALTGAIRKQSEEWPGLAVGGADLVGEEFAASADAEALINYLLAVLAVAYAAIAAINTLAVAVLSRRAEFGLQRLTGATRAQVRRMLLVEGGVVAALGLALGTGISAFTVWPTAFAAGSLLPSGPVWFVLAVVAAVVLIVCAATLPAARLAMRSGPLEAIGTAGR